MHWITTWYDPDFHGQEDKMIAVEKFHETMDNMFKQRQSCELFVG